MGRRGRGGVLLPAKVFCFLASFLMHGYSVITSLAYVQLVLVPYVNSPLTQSDRLVDFFFQ